MLTLVRVRGARKIFIGLLLEITKVLDYTVRSSLEPSPSSSSAEHFFADWSTSQPQASEVQVLPFGILDNLNHRQVRQIRQTILNASTEAGLYIMQTVVRLGCF